MSLVKLLGGIRYGWLFPTQLLQETSKQVVQPLLILPPKVKVDIRHADGWLALILTEEVVGYNRRKNGFSSSRDSRTEEYFAWSL